MGSATQDVGGRLRHVAPSSQFYPGENNWQECRRRMNEAARHIANEFRGEAGEYDRLLGVTHRERASETLHARTGGRLGAQHQDRYETVHTLNLFTDRHEPPWHRLNTLEEFKDRSQTVCFERLRERVMDNAPYPTRPLGDTQPYPGRVYQGDVEDFYLVQAMHALSMKPELVRHVFADDGKGPEFSDPPNCSFILRFYKHAQWQHIEIDDRLPQDMEGQPLCSRSEFWPNYSWPALIEKAYAKLHGSWQGVGDGGHCEEAMVDLTGGCASRFWTADVAGDRLFKYINDLKGHTIFGCNINEDGFAKMHIPIQNHWAAAIWDVYERQGVPYICVCLTAPFTTVRALPLCDVPYPGTGYGPSNGFVWLRMDDFTELFDVIYECRLVCQGLQQHGGGGPGAERPHHSLGGQHHSIGSLQHHRSAFAIWRPNSEPGKPQSPIYETIWACPEQSIMTDDVPFFFFDIGPHECPVEIMMDASQTDARYRDQGRKMQNPLLIRFFQCGDNVDLTRGGDIYMVHMSAWGHNRDAMCCVKVLRPGKYLMMISAPSAYACNRMIVRVYTTMRLRTIAADIPSPAPIYRSEYGNCSWIPTPPNRPLNAIPYSLVGYVTRGDALGDRLPRMFDESEGRGKPGLMNDWQNAQHEAATRFGYHLPNTPHIGRRTSGADREAAQMGHKAMGHFGGGAATATTDATEAGETTVDCSVM